MKQTHADKKKDVDGSAQQSGRCAFYARRAAASSSPGFSAGPPSRCFLPPRLFGLFCCHRAGASAARVASTVCAAEQHATATCVGVLKSSLHPWSPIGWRKSPLPPHWSRDICDLHYFNSFSSSSFFFSPHSCRQPSSSCVTNIFSRSLRLLAREDDAQNCGHNFGLF